MGHAAGLQLMDCFDIGIPNPRRANRRISSAAISLTSLASNSASIVREEFSRNHPHCPVCRKPS
jgi:hypothetical protein